ncbi:DEAD/DEAH box helicase [Staphylococcus petrasii]|uniref:DEAD/DEAH box helicase n=1 Tax=Staphylococcus petrasii TaxID=1276936 RepID=UPI001F589090|nr:DEAD/DEAH box helicase [Staphylococcus petrasii]MCI2774788.1 DEAD/DEAH box helicase [Staphylococcus petrasii]
MEEKVLSNLQQSLNKGFIDKNITHEGNMNPKLLNNSNNQNILSSIISELDKCISFYISVAFITESGLASLKAVLSDLNDRGVKGRIITSNYLGFNTPKMYKELLKLENVEVRLTDISGFHAKGYIFEHENYSSMIIGSSNLTSTALKINYEHNVMLSTHKNGDLIYNVKNQFEDLWENSVPLNVDWIKEYEESFESKIYRDFLELNKEHNKRLEKFTNSNEIKPNLMQEEALMGLKKLREADEHKGLVISATGTGKTILCALDVRNYAPKKFLFIVHNEGILKKAKEEFKKVLPHENEEDFGLYTGNEKNSNAKYIFATIQTLSKEDNYNSFRKDEFDYIVFDEAHRTAARTYQTIFNYFTPDFMLGMTATPERTDEGNIFELFDNNVAYEIRLPKALESDILCPFHYFGVTDYVHNGVEKNELSDLKELVAEERIDHIINKTNYYGYSGEELKGLIFVSRKEEAIEIAQKLTLRGLPSKSLIGTDSQNKRLKIIGELVDGSINYIVVVDLFNEGIDIPEVNQIVMLRSTQSSIIFIQQLGRGLRKSSNKEFVTIIDFIGNYKNNYLIPIALSDNQSQNKDDYRRFMTNPNQLEGVSTINFEEIAKKKISEAIDKATLNSMQIIKEAFKKVKERIGKTPMLIDFIEQNSIDPKVILSKNEFGNYYLFLRKYDYTNQQFSEDAIKNLTFLSREILPGLKRSDYLVLEKIIEGDKTFDQLCAQLEFINKEDINTSLKILSLSYFGKNEQARYGNPIIEYNNIISLSKTFKSYLENKDYQDYVDDIIAVAKYYNNKFQESGNNLILYNQYSRLDFLKLVNWRNDEKNMSNNIYGYRVLDNFIPVFITYKKSEDIDDNIKYEDHFLSQDELAWVSRANASLKSNEIQDIIHHKEKNKNIYIFVKKSDAEGTLHYYLGEAEYIEGTAKEESRNIGDRVVTMNLAMKSSIRDDIYRYIVEE